MYDWKSVMAALLLSLVMPRLLERRRRVTDASTTLMVLLDDCRCYAVCYCCARIPVHPLLRRQVSGKANANLVMDPPVNSTPPHSERPLLHTIYMHMDKGCLIADIE